jgi:tetratricopeptide (TPR) repeat protein
VLESTPSSQARIATLRKRWEADRGSSAFLPLAEEYRRLGRFRDAIDTLEAGLRMQPAYLSAQVALGRCLLESGDAPAAAQVLERVLATDPTQLVANKLLVEAYLRAGHAKQALGRLDTYTALNDRDPDALGLRQRIFTALQKEPAAGASPIGAAGEPAVFAAAQTPLGLDDPDPLFALADGIEPPSDLSALWNDAGNGERGSGAAPAWPAGSGNGDDLFPGLGTASAHRLYLAALLEDGLFARIPARMIAPDLAAAPEAAPAPDTAAGRESAVAPEAAAAPEQEAAPETTAATNAAPATEATVTLGELYRRQGHLGEAAEIFHAVLEREPGNAAAQDGLTLTQEAAAAPAAAPDAWLGEGVTARKIRALRGYLQGLRRGAAHDVS